MRAPELRNACPRDWETLPGDERVRHCPHCRRDVTNLSAMSPAAARRFLAEDPDACVRFRSDDAGRIVRERPRLPTLAVLASLTACATWQDRDAPEEPEQPTARSDPRLPDDAVQVESRAADDRDATPRVSPTEDAIEPTAPAMDDAMAPATEDAPSAPIAATDSERAPLERRVEPSEPYTRRELRELRRAYRPRGRSHVVMGR